MGNKQTFRIRNDQIRIRVLDAVAECQEGFEVVIQEPVRNLSQNAKLWAMLAEVEEQLIWHGYKLTAYEWKDFFTASLFEYKIVPNMDSSGFIGLGKSSSKLRKKEFSD